MPAYQLPWMDDELRMFRASVRKFVQKEFVPQQECWCRQRFPDPGAWPAAGAIGMLMPDVPAAYGGAGGHFGHACVVIEELARAGINFGAMVQGVVARYILSYGDEAQRQRWLPAMARGELIGAIAMTEPGAGSDVQAIRTTARRVGDRYIVNGTKTFVSNGVHAGIVCLAVKTDPAATGPKGISMLMVETRDLRGYEVGRSLEKVGMHGQDTCELFFNDVSVPAANLLGSHEGKGYQQMMEQLPYERMLVAVSAIAVSEQAVDITTRYVQERAVFGKALMDYQNTRFKLADCRTEAHIGRVFIDHCIQRCIDGHLDDRTSAMAKLWLTESQCRIVDECLQLHGGYGYMTEYPIARMWADSRVRRIYAGSNEIMKELIACSL